jgi:GxxExxY protein
MKQTKKDNLFNKEKNKKLLFKEESYKIMGACFEVYKDKGTGFLEGVYQECLKFEFTKREIPFIEKSCLEIQYKGEKISQIYQPDFICFNDIIVETKAVKTLVDEHRAQIHNYLKATNKHLGILVNFGHYPKVEYERIVI